MNHRRTMVNNHHTHQLSHLHHNVIVIDDDSVPPPRIIIKQHHNSDNEDDEEDDDEDDDDELSNNDSGTEEDDFKTSTNVHHHNRGYDMMMRMVVDDDDDENVIHNEEDDDEDQDDQNDEDNDEDEDNISMFQQQVMVTPSAQSRFDHAHHQSQQPMSQQEPYAYIVEQPAKCGVRFRYECEGRISSAIPGVSSSTINCTFPTISVTNYQGPIKVIVSCVTKNEPYRPHPHNLVGKKFCQQGICVVIFSDSQNCQFNNLGILCAKRKDIRERLRVRQSLQVDPFGTGFEHGSHTFKLIDLTVVRLCFQIFLPDAITGKFSRPLKPIVSDDIYDKKAMSELTIAKLSQYSAPVLGGQSVIMLCDRVVKDDIEIRFFQYDPNDGRLIWEKLAEFDSNDVHKHFAITFRVPSYDCLERIDHRNQPEVIASHPEEFDDDTMMLLNSSQHHHPSLHYHRDKQDNNQLEMIAVNVELRRPSDGCVSEPIEFYYYRSMVTSIHHQQLTQSSTSIPLSPLSSSTLSSPLPSTAVQFNENVPNRNLPLVTTNPTLLYPCANNISGPGFVPGPGGGGSTGSEGSSRCSSTNERCIEDLNNKQTIRTSPFDYRCEDDDNSHHQMESPQRHSINKRPDHHSSPIKSFVSKPEYELAYSKMLFQPIGGGSGHHLQSHLPVQEQQQLHHQQQQHHTQQSPHCFNSDPIALYYSHVGVATATSAATNGGDGTSMSTIFDQGESLTFPVTTKNSNNNESESESGAIYRNHYPPMYNRQQRTTAGDQQSLTTDDEERPLILDISQSVPFMSTQ